MLKAVRSTLMFVLVVSMFGMRAQGEPAVHAIKGDCHSWGHGLFGGFPPTIPKSALVIFSDPKGRWKQLLILPAENWWAGPIDAPQTQIETSFLAQGLTSEISLPVDCSAISWTTSDAINVSGAPCPSSFTHVDNGPISAARQLYADSTEVVGVFTVRDSKFGAAGIVGLSETFSVYLDGELASSIPVRGYEPQTVSVTVPIRSRGHHALVFGTTGVTDGTFCF